MRPRFRHKVLPVVGVICALVSSSLRPAQAQPPPTADRMKEVKKACASGDFDRGVRLLADIYAETNDATAIYNQGRCYQQNAEPERAASRFREYLRKARDLSAADRAEVEGFIREADAEAAVKAQRAAQPAPAPVPAPPVAPAPGPQWNQPAPTYAPPATYAPLPTPAPPPVRTSRNKGLMIAGMITLGVTYVLTLGIGSAVKDWDAMDCTNCKDVGEAFYVPILGPWLVYNDEAKGADPDGLLLPGYSRKDLNWLAVMAGTAQGIGAVLTGIGITLFVTSGKPKPVSAVKPVTMVPTFAPLAGGGFGGLRGTF